MSTREALRRVAPWLMPAGALIVVLALYLSPAAQLEDAAFSDVVMASRSQVESALQAKVANEPVLKDREDEIRAKDPDAQFEWKNGVLTCPVRRHDYRLFLFERRDGGKTGREGGSRARHGR